MKNAYFEFIRVPQRYLGFGLLSLTLTLVAGLLPMASIVIVYFIMPYLYVSVGQFAAGNGDKKAVLKELERAVNLGFMVIVPMIFSLVLIISLFQVFADSQTIGTLLSIIEKAQNDPQLMEDMFMHDIEWYRYLFLLIALFTLGFVLFSLSLQSWFIHVFEGSGFFLSLWQGVKRSAPRLDTWLLLSILIFITLGLEGILFGLVKVVTFPFLALTHYFLYKKMNS